MFTEAEEGGGKSSFLLNTKRCGLENFAFKLLKYRPASTYFLPLLLLPLAVVKCIVGYPAVPPDAYVIKRGGASSSKQMLLVDHLLPCFSSFSSPSLVPPPPAFVLIIIMSSALPLLSLRLSGQSYNGGADGP